MQKLLEGKNVLVTGGGQNIGKSICLEAASEGANVYAVDFDVDRLHQAEKELKKLSKSSAGFICDISNEEQIHRLCQDHLKDKSIDILINNAGHHSVDIRFSDFDLKEFRKTFQTNLFGPMALTQDIVRKMIQSGLGGSILFISSIHEKIVRGKIAYSSSKAALKMVVQELSVDLAGFGIRVNGISPGYVKVNEKGEPLPQKHTPLWNTSIPPEYIGRAAVYLSSDHFSRFTTGSILKIDAGLSLNNFAFDPGIRKGNA